MLAGVKRVKIGDAVDTEDDGLAVEDEPLLPVLERGLDNPEIALGPIVSAASDQPDAIAVALCAEAKAVLLDLVKPLRAGGNHSSRDRDAELKRLKHAAKIGICGEFCESDQAGAGLQSGGIRSPRPKRLYFSAVQACCSRHS